MVPQDRARRAFRFSMKVARLSTFMAVVGGIFTIFLARSVYGSATESVFNLNQEWARHAGKLDKQSYRVIFNGQAMMTSSHEVEASMKEVLDDAEAHCRSRSNDVEKDFARLPQWAMMKVSSVVFGVVRHETDHRGYVACIENEGRDGLAGIGAGMNEVARTGDVGKLGTFRYTTVDRSPGASRTHVLRQWTEGSFNLTTLFPKEGDAPGSDLTEVPRPESSRRMLDASIEGSRFGVRIYDTAGTPAPIFALYDREMGPRGWKRIELTEKDDRTMRVYDAPGGQVFLTVTPHGARSSVAIASMPN